MGIYEGRGTLTKAMKELENKWHSTLGEWHDARSEEFEKRFLEPLKLDLHSAVATMDQVAVVLTKIESDCQ